ncbi:hypothetical protein VB774_14040 [Pseudanabaena galeata UHCC 0370]|uniref:Uncharacterized protein n=1 Tax=Pseudanabaena galeata UHCC 0370 TaxID=3110310 RepID=A0ABU5TL61_9CYAN|nr:hypothetical protein [Pseudanabaena galeata]MEA5478743.1 hypothetical protein [Pseudanabaena galeata UHCC 0370]
MYFINAISPTTHLKKTIAQSITKNAIAQSPKKKHDRLTTHKNAIAQPPTKNTIAQFPQKSPIAQSSPHKNAIAKIASKMLLFGSF